MANKKSAGNLERYTEELTQSEMKIKKYGENDFALCDHAIFLC